MKKSLMIFSLLLGSLGSFFTTEAMAAKGSQIQLRCESKAKEIAQITYTECIQENRSAELEKIKKEYVSNQKKMKAAYEKRIRSLMGKKSAIKAQEPAAPTESITEASNDMTSEEPAQEEISKSFKETVTPEKIEASSIDEESSDANPDFQ